ncbi:MAG: hypothetical protein ACLP9L_14770 [Thermoguttaceae bacterium]
MDSKRTKSIVRSDIQANIGRVFRIHSTIDDWPGRVEKWLGRRRWDVYDLENKQHAVKHTEDIVGLWDGDFSDHIVLATTGVNEGAEVCRGSGPPHTSDPSQTVKHFTDTMENQDSDRLTPEQRHRLGVLVAKIETAHQQDEQANHDGLESLAEIWRDRLYREFGSLEEFVNRQFQGKSRQWAYNKIAQVTVLENLKGIGVEHISEKKAQLLKNFEPDVQRAIAAEAGDSRSNADWQRIAASHASRNHKKGHKKGSRNTTARKRKGAERKKAASQASTDRFRHRAKIRYATGDRQVAGTRLIETLDTPWSDFWPKDVGPTPNMTKVTGTNQDGNLDVVEIEFDNRFALFGLLANWADCFNVTLSYQEE